MSATDHPRPYRRGSEHGPGPQCLVSTDDLRAWRERLEQERRPGGPTALHVKVLLELPKRLGADGQCYPSHAFLAKAAKCSVRTVRTAIAWGKRLGLVRVTRRIVLVPWPQGGRNARRAVQTSNAYELLPPTGPIDGGKPLLQLRRQVLPRKPLGKVSLLERTASVLPPVPYERQQEARKALARVRESREPVITAHWQSERAKRQRGAAVLHC